MISQKTSPTVVGVGQAMPESQQQSTTIQDNTYHNLHALTKKVHFVYVQYRSRKQFEVAVSLNHDIMTSF
jgi:hypothetical protein